MSRPNVLFFFTDDQRFDTIRALGNPQIQTPNMDRLVRDGTAFTHAYIPGGTSHAVCMPSRAMLHTGRGLFEIDGKGEEIPPDHRLLGEHLRASGYRTFGTGKWHNGRQAYHRAFSDGDDIFFGGMADHWNVPAYHYDPSGKYDQQFTYCINPAESNALWHTRCDHIHHGLHSSAMVGDAALRFLGDLSGGAPFFAYVAFLAPHDPRTMPDEFRQLYDPADIDLPPNFRGGHSIENGALDVRDERLAPFPRTARVVREHTADYYAMITHLDAQLGRVLDALDAAGKREDTIIVFAGDNGLALGQHGLFGKQSLYEHSTRVPLIMAGPGIPRDHRCDALVYLSDIYPTLCDLLQLPTPPSVTSSSLLPAIRGQKPPRDSLYLAYKEYQRAIRDPRYKLIEYVVDGVHQATQLFDLQDDPWETQNLAAEPSHAETVTALRRALIAQSEKNGDRDSSWGQTFWSTFDATAHLPTAI